MNKFNFLYLSLFFAAMIYISCNRTHITAEVVINSLAKKYQNSVGINFTTDFKEKFFNSSDTISIKANCRLFRNSSDSIFGGYIYMTTNDGTKRLYDLDNIYVSDSINKSVTIYNKNEDFAINGNFTFSIINEYFLKPNELFDIIKDTSIVKSLEINKNDLRKYHKIILKYPNENDFSNIRSIIWINKDMDMISSMQHITTFQGNTQFREWNNTAISYKSTDSAFFNTVSKQMKKNKKFTIEYYKEPDASYYELLSNGIISPDFEGVDLSTNKRIKFSEYRGKIVILDFYYISCMPCIQTIPHLSEIYSKYKNEEIVVLGINSKDNNANSIKKLPEFIKKNKMLYRTILVNPEVDKKYKVNVYPSMYVIDKEGKILVSQIGYNDNLKEGLSNYLDKILK